MTDVYEKDGWACSKPYHVVRWKEELETGMLHLAIHLVTPDGRNRGVVLEVSPNVLYPAAEGCHFPHTKITQHLLESQHETFDENEELKKQVERMTRKIAGLAEKVAKRDRKIRAARQTMRAWDFCTREERERVAALEEFLQGYEENDD